jgi:hypothetical protein
MYIKYYYEENIGLIIVSFEIACLFIISLFILKNSSNEVCEEIMFLVDDVLELDLALFSI